MDNTIFAQCVARIRFLETRMLDKAKIEALVESRDFMDSIRLLQDSWYGDYVTLPSYEDGLKKALQDFYREMYKICPVREIVDLLAVRYDGHNIKSLVKGKLSGTDASAMIIDAGTIPAETLKLMVEEDNFRDLPAALRACSEGAIEDYKETRDPQRIDITIDKGIYKYMLEVAGRSGLYYLETVTGLMIDVINIKSYIRIKIQEKGREFLRDVFMPGGRLDFDLFANSLNEPLENFPSRIAYTNYSEWVKEGVEGYIRTKDLGTIEKQADNYIIDYLKKAKLIYFGPEPVIAFMLAKENEMKALRIILTGKKNGVSAEFIRERLRDIYV